MSEGTMRLDRFLWFVRLAKTRNAAQALAAQSRLRIDGRPIDRAHAQVRTGNILTLLHNNRVRVIRIAALPIRRGPASEAQSCYEDLAPVGGENVSHQAAIDGRTIDGAERRA
uniref:RNA-binding S4 domain-containing protein n=1 Tax=Sphingomonas sp. TaxID=28214 RepID=UPI0025CDE561|nr:S4 domain-containing protein [Sphingomonas sp.]